MTTPTIPIPPAMSQVCLNDPHLPCWQGVPQREYWCAVCKAQQIPTAPAARGSEEAPNTARIEVESWVNEDARQGLTVDAVERLIARLTTLLATRDREVERLEAERARFDRALQSITPQGSEYVNDPERCVAAVREMSESQHRVIVKFKAERDALRRQYEHACDALGAIGRQLTAAGHTPAGSESDHSDYLTAVQTLMVERDTLQAQVEELKEAVEEAAVGNCKCGNAAVSCTLCIDRLVRSEIAIMEVALHGASEANKLLSAECDRLRTQLDAAEAERGLIADDLREQITETNSLRGQLDATQGEIKSLRELLAERGDQLDVAKIVENNLQTLLDSHDASIEAMRVQLDAVTRERDELRRIAKGEA